MYKLSTHIEEVIFVYIESILENIYTVPEWSSRFPLDSLMRRITFYLFPLLLNEIDSPPMRW